MTDASKFHFPSPVPTRPPRARQHCRHYDYETGMTGRGPICGLAIDLSAPRAALRCMPPDSTQGETCEKREDWTSKERAAWQAWLEEHTARTAIVMAVIPAKGYSGNLPCPGCGIGMVSWSRTHSNNHLHARCSTPHCFAIMQ
jgi:hypothetical protein